MSVGHLGVTCHVSDCFLFLACKVKLNQNHNFYKLNFIFQIILLDIKLLINRIKRQQSFYTLIDFF